MTLRTPARLVLVALWVGGALGILWGAVVAHIELLALPEPFELSGGAEQSMLIFEITGIYALIEAMLLAVRVSQGFWVRKGLTTVVLFGSFIWLLAGGPAYEPAYFSAAVATLLVASAWAVMLPRHLITPNTTPHADARDVPESAGAAGARASGRER